MTTITEFYGNYDYSASPTSSNKYSNNSLMPTLSPLDMHNLSAIMSADQTRKFGLAVNAMAYCYIMPVIAVFGILGNVANLMTLANPKLKAVSYMYLRALGIADLMCMCFVLVFVFFEILKMHNYETIVGDYGAAWYRAHLMLPLINTSVSAGILTVVALTIERYISICWPTIFRQWNTPSRALPLIVCAYAVPFVLYMPMCWQMELVPRKYYADGFQNDNSTPVMILWKDSYKDLLHTPSYHAYKWTRETLLKFIPIVSLTILNLQIILTFRQVRARRQRMTISAASNASNANHQQVREQRSLLILLAGIAILFFICNIPAAINLVFISEETKKLYGYILFRAIANIMEITNHALNFYVFCLCSTDYRQTFLQTFPCVKNVSQRTSDLRKCFGSGCWSFSSAKSKNGSAYKATKLTSKKNVTMVEPEESKGHLLAKNRANGCYTNTNMKPATLSTVMKCSKSMCEEIEPMCKGMDGEIEKKTVTETDYVSTDPTPIAVDCGDDQFGCILRHSSRIDRANDSSEDAFSVNSISALTKNASREEAILKQSTMMIIANPSCLDADDADDVLL